MSDKRPNRPAPEIELPASEIRDETGPAVGSADAPAAAPPVQRGSSVPVVGGAVAGAVFGLLASLGYQNLKEPPVTVADPRVAAVESELAQARTLLKASSEQNQRLVTQLEAAVERAAGAERKAESASGLAAAMIGPVDDRLKAAETRIEESQTGRSELAARLDQLAKVEPPKVDLAPLAQKISDVERTLGGQAERASQAGAAMERNDGRIAALEQALGTLQARKPAIDAVATLLVVAGHARAALESGAPLHSHIAALHAAGASEAGFAALKPFADKPAPRPADLAAELGKLATGLPKPAAQTGGSWLDRARTAVGGFVEVRPVGGASAESGGIVSRARAKMAGGNIAGALADLGGLDAAAREVLKPVMDAATAREAALAAIGKLEGDALIAASRKN